MKTFRLFHKTNTGYSTGKTITKTQLFESTDFLERQIREIENLEVRKEYVYSSTLKIARLT